MSILFFVIFSYFTVYKLGRYQDFPRGYSLYPFPYLLEKCFCTCKVRLLVCYFIVDHFFELEMLVFFLCESPEFYVVFRFIFFVLISGEKVKEERKKKNIIKLCRLGKIIGE